MNQKPVEYDGHLTHEFGQAVNGTCYGSDSFPDFVSVHTQDKEYRIIPGTVKGVIRMIDTALGGDVKSADLLWQQLQKEEFDFVHGVFPFFLADKAGRHEVERWFEQKYGSKWYLLWSFADCATDPDAYYDYNYVTIYRNQ